MIAIGGWTDSQTQKYTNLVQNIDNVKSFATDAVDFLHNNNFDGLDIDWEHPDTPEEKSAYVTWLQVSY